MAWAKFPPYSHTDARMPLHTTALTGELSFYLSTSSQEQGHLWTLSKEDAKGIAAGSSDGVLYSSRPTLSTAHVAIAAASSTLPDRSERCNASCCNPTTPSTPSFSPSHSLAKSRQACQVSVQGLPPSRNRPATAGQQDTSFRHQPPPRGRSD